MANIHTVSVNYGWLGLAGLLLYVNYFRVIGDPPVLSIPPGVGLSIDNTGGLTIRGGVDKGVQYRGTVGVDKGVGVVDNTGGVDNPGS
eukprot:7771698-Pyramimonas_sp.AAC.1